MELQRPILVAVGGVAGAGSRWAIGELVTDPFAAVVVVNAIGAFLLSGLVRLHREVPLVHRLWFGAGFCGALTTFSTLAVEIASRLDTGDTAGAALTTLVAFSTAIVAAVAGDRVGRARAGLAR